MYRACGPVLLESAEGNRPMTIIWRLARQAKLGDKPRYTWEGAALRWLNEQGHKASIRDDAKKIEFLTPFFKRLPLTELTWDRMQAVVEGQKGDKAPATRNRYYQLLRSILRRAMREWNWIDSVPTIRMHREPEGRVALDEIPVHAMPTAATAGCLISGRVLLGNASSALDELVTRVGLALQTTTEQDRAFQESVRLVAQERERMHMALLRLLEPGKVSP